MDVQLHRVSTAALLEALRRHQSRRFQLTDGEAKIFAALKRNPGWFVSVKQLADELYGDRADGGPLDIKRIVYLHIHRIRRKVPNLHIENKYTHGYRLLEAA